MRNLLRYSLLLGLTALTYGCDFSVDMSIRSGSDTDDYVEEPLNTLSKKYANALNISNRAIEKIKNNQLEALYNEYFAQEFKKNSSLNSLKELLRTINSSAGRIKGYKKFQWNFTPGSENGRKLLWSIKIVEHEKLLMEYFFVFVDDGKYERLIGIHIKQKEGVNP